MEMYNHFLPQRFSKIQIDAICPGRAKSPEKEREEAGRAGGRSAGEALYGFSAFRRLWPSRRKENDYDVAGACPTGRARERRLSIRNYRLLRALARRPFRLIRISARRGRRRTWERLIRAADGRHFARANYSLECGNPLGVGVCAHGWGCAWSKISVGSLQMSGGTCGVVFELPRLRNRQLESKEHEGLPSCSGIFRKCRLEIFMQSWRDIAGLEDAKWLELIIGSTSCLCCKIFVINLETS